MSSMRQRKVKKLFVTMRKDFRTLRTQKFQKKHLLIGRGF